MIMVTEAHTYTHSHMYTMLNICISIPWLKRRRAVCFVLPPQKRSQATLCAAVFVKNTYKHENMPHRRELENSGFAENGANTYYRAEAGVGRVRKASKRTKDLVSAGFLSDKQIRSIKYKNLSQSLHMGWGRRPSVPWISTVMDIVVALCWIQWHELFKKFELFWNNEIFNSKNFCFSNFLSKHICRIVGNWRSQISITTLRNVRTVLYCRHSQAERLLTADQAHMPPQLLLHLLHSFNTQHDIPTDKHIFSAMDKSSSNRSWYPARPGVCSSAHVCVCMCCRWILACCVQKFLKRKPELASDP